MRKLRLPARLAAVGIIGGNHERAALQLLLKDHEMLRVVCQGREDTGCIGAEQVAGKLARPVQLAGGGVERVEPEFWLYFWRFPGDAGGVDRRRRRACLIELCRSQ